MKQLKKNYYPLPEAEERSNQPIDDFLCLAEHRDIRLWVVAHDWPIVWSEEKPVTGNPTIEAKKPIKPPFDYYYSGYLNLCSNDILRLRVNEEVSLSTVFAEKEGQEFIGDIKRDDSSYLFRQHEFDFEIDNVFVSHEDLLRVENREVGDWQIKSESTPIDDTVDRRSGGKRRTQTRNARWRGESQKLAQKNPDKSKSWIAKIIAKDSNLNPKRRDWQTIRRYL